MSAESDPIAASYDEIPYHGTAFHYTHPDRLAANAILFGLEPPRVRTARVLELGCAEGANLIPMALTLPEARFVGIDLSPRQVAAGQERIAALGLTNIELRTLSILDVDESLGAFDYIICHGVFSWVPEKVRETILEILDKRLALQGVGYVSYNTYPGWHVRGMIRDMLRYHARRFDDPMVKLRQSRAFLDFLVKAAVYPDLVYTRLLRVEHEMLERSEDSYFFHEHLEQDNHPLYFHEFHERLRAHGLEYLSEATFNASEANLPGPTREVLHQISQNPIEREQYLDFLCNRTFRRSLIVHAGLPIQRIPQPQIMRRFHVTTRVLPEPAEEAAMRSDATVDYRSQDRDVHLATNRPLVKLALWVLYQNWPRALTLDALWAAVRPQLATTGERALAEADDPQPLAEVLLRAALSDILELSVEPPPFATTVSERPVASPLARLMAPGTMPVINLRHRIIATSDFEDILLPLLDGTRDRDALLRDLMPYASDEDVTFYKGEEPIRDPEQIREALAAMLDAALRNLARNALLTA